MTEILEYLDAGGMIIISALFVYMLVKYFPETINRFVQAIEKQRDEYIRYHNEQRTDFLKAIGDERLQFLNENRTIREQFIQENKLIRQEYLEATQKQRDQAVEALRENMNQFQSLMAQTSQMLIHEFENHVRGLREHYEGDRK